MSKKILILSGSPRKGGNSDILCEEFTKGAKESGNNVEKIYLDDLKIAFCKACYACRNTGKCFQKDDMEEVLNKMVEADVIVLATPVYFYAMDAQMKVLIDRTLPRYTEISNKDFYLIATAAAGKASMERTIEGLRGFLDCCNGAREKGVIYGHGAWNKGDIEGSKAMREAYEAGINA